MSLITTSVLGVTGIKPTFAAAAAGDLATPSARNFFVVKNGSGGSVTVTLAVPGNGPNSVALPDTAIAVAAGDEAWIPLDTYYKDPSDGLVHISYSATATVTRAVVQR